MGVFSRILATLAMILLGAHFLRDGHMELVSVCLMAIVPAWLPWRGTRLLTQIVLVIAALQWVRTLIGLIDLRQATGKPWLRAAIILGSVAAFNLAVCLLLGLRSSRRYEKSAVAGPSNMAGAD